MTKPQSAGGIAVKNKECPSFCPRCGKEFPFLTPYHSYLGHLGLHGLADRYFAGNIEAAQKRLRENGLARQDPAPYNRAFKPYRPVNQ